MVPSMLSLRILASFSLCVCGLAADKAPITHETMWLMKRVGAPKPSPDGKWVVFQVTEPAYDAKDQVSDLWIVPADGSSKPRRLTFTKGAESDVDWSADSRRIAFSAKREGDEENQIYVLDVAAGGEAQRVTNVIMGASLPRWSPDGASILFQSKLYPGAADEEANRKVAAERKALKYRARTYGSFPIRHWDKWLDETKPHLFLQSLEPGAKPKILLAGAKLAAQPGFDAPTTTSGWDFKAVWAPGGASIVFVAATNRNAAAYAHVVTHLYQAPAGGGEPRQLTSGPDSFTDPTFRPDGKALYAVTSRNNQKIYNLDRLAMLSWPEPGAPKILTASFDRSVGRYAVTPDSRTICLLAEDAGHDKLYSLPAEGGQVGLVFDLTLGSYSNLAIPEQAAAPMLLANWESGVNPPEVVRIDALANKHRNLTEFNTERAAAVDWQPVRHFWFTSKAGKKIHNMIALPPNFDENKKYPLVLFIHGGPHSMFKDQFVLRWNYHLLASPGYVILLTNYTGSTGFGEKFAQEIQLDPLRGPGNELNEAADEAIRRFPFIDATRQAAGGASYGGHMANWLQATTTRYKCLYSHAGLINLESQWGTSDLIYHRELGSGGPVWEQGKVWREQNPIRFAKNFRTPILLTIGENDFRVPLNQTLENWSVLQRLRIPSRLVVFPDENHWILKGENSRFFYQELLAWLKKHL